MRKKGNVELSQVYDLSKMLYAFHYVVNEETSTSVAGISCYLTITTYLITQTSKKSKL